jgi:hypothetical protein
VQADHDLARQRPSGPKTLKTRLDQQRLQEISTAVNVQIRPWLLLEFGDFFRNVSA